MKVSKLMHRDVVTCRTIDTCMAAYTRGAPLRAIPVASTMAREVFTCGPDDELAVVEREMSRHQIRRMPVIDMHGQPIGMISLNDIARASQAANSVSTKEVASTLAAICAPRELVVEAAAT
jgi:predicted transcriptional regulator